MQITWKPGLCSKTGASVGLGETLELAFLTSSQGFCCYHHTLTVVLLQTPRSQTFTQDIPEKILNSGPCWGKSRGKMSSAGRKEEGSCPFLSDEEILDGGSEEDLGRGCPHPGDHSGIHRPCISFRESSGIVRIFCDLVAKAHFYHYDYISWRHILACVITFISWNPYMFLGDP